MNAPLPTEATVLAVDWQSELDMSILEEGLRLFGLRLTTENGAPLFRVLDLRGSPDLDSALASYHGESTPTLVIASDSEQLARVFPALIPADDICTAEGAAVEAGCRLGRLFMAARERAATVDALTGLANRQSFLSTFEWTLDQAAPETPVSLAMADIDNFKSVNDTHGHQAGDEVLSALGDILRRGARGCEVVARLGGEEFVVVIKASSAQARALAEYLREEVADHVFTFSDLQFHVTVSFGVATADSKCEANELIHRADQALYSAKAEGRNRVVCEEDLASHSGEDVEIQDFENRVRVLTERMTQKLMHSGRRLAGRYRHEADTDGLTGLFVRRYFDKRLPREMENARRSSRPLSLIFLDIDHFGSVNKTHGFPTGDRALQYAAKVAERIRVNIGGKAVRTYGGADLSLTASLGVAELAADDASPEDFVQRAGDKTRQAKEAGRDRVCF